MDGLCVANVIVFRSAIRIRFLYKNPTHTTHTHNTGTAVIHTCIHLHGHIC